MVEAEDNRPRGVLLFEPFDGGSHAAFARGLAAHSGHRITIAGLPARHWKWRMHGSAVSFAEEYAARRQAGERWDLIIVTSLVDVSDFRARLSLLPWQPPPILLYVHETQFDYPHAPGEPPDARYGFRNLLSIAAADAALFNSASHRRRFFRDAEAFLKRLPKPVPGNLLPEARAKSSVLYPGVEDPAAGARVDPFATGNADAVPGTGVPPRRTAGSAVSPGDRRTPLILWNHRWEHDKNPEAFFSVLMDVDRPELPWRLAVAGERYRRAPAVFDEAYRLLAHRITHFGYLPQRPGYLRLLRESDLVISTAGQENFGISVVEAILAGATPLLPNRLSYPELLPAESRGLLLYGEPGGGDGDREALAKKLREFLVAPGPFTAAAAVARRRLRNYRWELQAPRFDAVIERLIRRRRRFSG